MLQVLLSLRHLARFHACSFAMKTMLGLDWQNKLGPTLASDHIHGKEHQDIFAKFHEDMNEHYLGLIKVGSGG